MFRFGLLYFLVISFSSLLFADGSQIEERLIIKGIASPTVDLFEAQDAASSKGFRIESDFDVVIGSGATGKDYTITLNGEDNSGVLTWFEDEDRFDFSDIVKTSSGIIVNTTRATTTDTIDTGDHVYFGNTDSAAFTVTLPAGAEGLTYKIINSGSSGNNLDIAPNGSDDLIGANSNFVLSDGESLVISFNATDGWY